MKPPIKICNRTIRHFRLLLGISDNKYIKFSVSESYNNLSKYTIEATSDTSLKKNDLYFNIAGIDFSICGKNKEQLVGSKLKWKTDIIGSRIEFTPPKNIPKSCDCGRNF